VVISNPITQLISCKRGRFLVNPRDTYIGRSLYLYGEYCDDEVNLLSLTCSDGDVVIDGGANIGALTIPLSRSVGNGKVVAFEPQQVLFQNLCANACLNNVTNLIALPMGLGECPKTLYYDDQKSYEQVYNYGNISLSSNANGNAVQVVTLDSIFERYQLKSLKLLKLDIEGMELSALMGAENVISEFHPFLYVENDRKEQSDDLIFWLLNKDYRIYLHNTPYYNTNNYFGYGKNETEGSSINLFCFHREQSLSPDISNILQSIVEIKSPEQISFKDNTVSWQMY